MPEGFFIAVIVLIFVKNLTCHGIFCWWRKLPHITWYTSFTTFGALLFYLTKVVDSIIL